MVSRVDCLTYSTRTLHHDDAVLWRHSNRDVACVHYNNLSSAGEQTGDMLHMCMCQCERM